MSCGHRQAQLIEDLLDVSRITSGNLRMQVGVIDLAAVIDVAVDSVRLAAEAKNIRLTTRFDGEASPIAGDATRLQQVLWNLLSNAIKFTPQGGHVEVAVRPAGARVVIEVRDTGEGIDPDFLPHVFERFRQGDGTATRTRGGLGLGLSIIRHLVELHGGRVRAESAGPARGSTFAVELPALPSGAVAATGS